MAGAVKPANPASTVLREIIRASFDEARPKRNAARRSFHNLPLRVRSEGSGAVSDSRLSPSFALAGESVAPANFSSRPARATTSGGNTMTRILTIRRRAVLVAAMALAAPAIARAEAYPARSVRVVNAYSPGGTADVVCRILLPGCRTKLGQTFAVDNKPGAAGTIAAQIVARAPADGYTLLYDATAHSVNPSLFGRQAALRHAARPPAGVPVDADAQHADAQCAVRGQDDARADRPGEEQAGRPRLRLDRHRHGAACLAGAPEPACRHQDQSRALQGDGRGAQRSLRRPRAAAVQQRAGQRRAALGQGSDLHGALRAAADRGAAGRAGHRRDPAGLRDLGMERRVRAGRHRSRR